MLFRKTQIKTIKFAIFYYKTNPIDKFKIKNGKGFLYYKENAKISYFQIESNKKRKILSEHLPFFDCMI